MKEDLAQIQRIYWIDDKPQSAQGLASPPRFFAAFFPETAEQELLRMELAYANLSYP